MANKWTWAGKDDSNKSSAPMVNTNPSAGAYGYRWRKRAKQYLHENPLCVSCIAINRPNQATQVDHITPHRGDLSDQVFWNEDNWQALCGKCHAVKTNNETMSGRRVIVTGLIGAGKSTYVQTQSSRGDIIFDYDLLVETMIVGHCDKRTNPKELIGLFETLRYSLVAWVKQTATRRSVWIICTNKNTAAVIAEELSGNVIDLG